MHSVKPYIDEIVELSRNRTETFEGVQFSERTGFILNMKNYEANEQHREEARIIATKLTLENIDVARKMVEEYNAIHGDIFDIEELSIKESLHEAQDYELKMDELLEELLTHPVPEQTEENITEAKSIFVPNTKPELDKYEKFLPMAVMRTLLHNYKVPIRHSNMKNYRAFVDAWRPFILD